VHNDYDTKPFQGEMQRKREIFLKISKKGEKGILE